MWKMKWREVEQLVSMCAGAGAEIRILTAS